MAGQGADERPLAALWPQVRVDGEERALRRGALAGPDQPDGEPGGRLQRRLVGRLAAAGVVVVRLGDEDHVDVARVVELAGAALAHRHHCEPDRRGIRRELGPGDREGGLEYRVGEVGELLGHLVDGGVAGHVARGEVQQPTVVGGGQPLDRVLARAARSWFRWLRWLRRARGGLRVVGVGGHGTEELRADRLRVRPPGRLLAAQHGDVLGVAGQVVGHGLADAEDGGKPRAETPRPRKGRRSGRGPARRPAPGPPGRGPGRRPARRRRATGGPRSVMPRAASSRSALGTSAKPILRQPAGQGGTRAAHGNERIPAARAGGNTRVTRGSALSPRCTRRPRV